MGTQFLSEVLYESQITFPHAHTQDDHLIQNKQMENKSDPTNITNGLEIIPFNNNIHRYNIVRKKRATLIESVIF